jgi:Flp pilus assembly protein TadD
MKTGLQWLCISALFVVLSALALPRAYAGDLRITIPKHSKLTPVQRLNRDGVAAVRKQHYKRAEQLFYKAYLLDPDDPFTLNNLGYISEIQGQLDRAEHFYELARQQNTSAVVDAAGLRKVQGLPLDQVLNFHQPVQADRYSVEATRLLWERRPFDADQLLQSALQSDSRNVFALNDMGVAKEMEGEPQQALKYYDQAAKQHSSAIAVLTLNRQMKGRPVSEIAKQSAQNLRRRLAKENDIETRVEGLNVRGVAAANRNDLSSAADDFRNAYRLNPNDPFTLNNIGYVAEMEGDRETAQFYYDQAQKALGANATVGLATRRSVIGMRLLAVSANSDTSVQSTLKQERNALRQTQEPVVLRRRDGSVVQEHAPSASRDSGVQPQP